MQTSLSQSGTSRRINVRKITMTAMLSAVSSVLMFFSFNVPLMPSFIKMDLSELPALIAAYTIGAGVRRGGLPGKKPGEPLFFHHRRNR